MTESVNTPNLEPLDWYVAKYANRTYIMFLDFLETCSWAVRGSLDVQGIKFCPGRGIQGWDTVDWHNSIVYKVIDNNIADGG